ncbi:MAG: c-type cytochrome [Gammaproteobacteria bacterium]|nr:c-type cytochrome [Gammaproteobacteria bacterium]MCP4286431.1 c-type cytochrome [Gammaproteobacteria bacterium]
MKSEMPRLCAVAVASLFAVSASSIAVAAEKRCTIHTGDKVECPVQSEEALAKAEAAYGAEADNMAAGNSGSTYGIQPFDYLTGVGKRTDKTTLNKGESGYGGSLGGGTGKTELWDRVKAPAKGEGIYNQWTHNWSPTFKKTMVAGADPNEGKQWYYMYCLACHGWLLQGDGPSAAVVEPRPRILTKGDYMNKKSNLQLFTVIKGGGEAVGLSSSMPSWGNYMQDQDIWNVIAWLRAMADVGVPKDLKEYLNPVSSFKPIPGDVDALTAKKNEEFQEEQEMLETGLAGRGIIPGGGYVDGGLRKKPEDVNKKVAGGY